MLLQEEKEEEDGKHGQNVEILFSESIYILHHNTTNFCIQVIFHTFFTLIINHLEIESKNEVFSGDRP